MLLIIATAILSTSQGPTQTPTAQPDRSGEPALRQLLKTDRKIIWSSAGPPPESAQATISLCEALIAQTGSIFVSSACGGRGASIVAPVHIVYATLDQLVPDLETTLLAATRNQTLSRSSFAGVISGSSRTADIEKILVQGAHGPRRLVVILQAAC